jgi:hypothetical protein
LFRANPPLDDDVNDDGTNDEFALF